MAESLRGAPNCAAELFLGLGPRVRFIYLPWLLSIVVAKSTVCICNGALQGRSSYPSVPPFWPSPDKTGLRDLPVVVHPIPLQLFKAAERSVYASIINLQLA